MCLLRKSDVIRYAHNDAARQGLRRYVASQLDMRYVFASLKLDMLLRNSICVAASNA